MGVTINVNRLSLCHRDSGGISSATLPDVCKTPPVPTPIPYPNVAFSKDLSNGTRTVFADGGNSIAHRSSEFSVSTGDEPGTAGGVKSGTFTKEATWISFSPNVKFEGQSVCRLTDKMFHNHQNTVNLAGLVQAVLTGLPCDTTPTPVPDELKCTCEYYKFRHDDFVRRMGPCGFSPPDYYLSYGFYYCEKFSTKIRPTLSPAGQAWLDRARCLLQERMEDGLKKDPSIELDNDKFRKFAFDTHPGAYWDAGLHDLPPGDWWKIGKTPEWKEFLNRDTYAQGWDIFKREVGAEASDAWSWTKDKGGGAWKATKDGWQWIKGKWPW